MRAFAPIQFGLVRIVPTLVIGVTCSQSWAGLPIRFEENWGQTHEDDGKWSY